MPNVPKKKKIEKERLEQLPVKFFNTLSKEKEVFTPRTDSGVGMYTCGPTVYNYAHIGNLRSYIFSDTIKRVLTYNGYSVTHVINITDVGHLVSDSDNGEDKMTLALKRERKPRTLEAMLELGNFYTKAFEKDLELLNIQKPSFIPKASEHIPEQIAYIQTLDEKGYAYTTSDGVYFDTSKFKEYGALSKSTESDEEYARIEINHEKKQAADFSLWKFNKKLGWDSPWGKGFPGWHIECTAMSTKYLGKSFDIHTGGMDHIQIHHNNEIAQTEATTGKKFVNYWMHNAFITIEGKKISKSLRNEILLRNVTDRGFSPLVYRYWLLTAHYRSPINFTWEAMEGSQKALFKLHRHFVEKLGTKKGTISDSYKKRFLSYINEDLNTAQAIALLFELLKDDSLSKPDARATFLDFDRVLGIGFDESNSKLLENLSGGKHLSIDQIPRKVKLLLDDRKKARNSEDWELADKLRVQIENEGYNVDDTSEGPIVSEK